MNWFADALRDNPELALFLTLAIGFALGRIRIGSFELGPIVGCLFAGVVVGQLGIPVSQPLKNAFFLLFLFAIGYRTGPLFFRGLKATALPQVALTVILCLTALATTYTTALLFGFDAGAAGGLVAGAMTSAAAVGTAGDAIVRMVGDAATAETLLANRTVAFAVTYLLGMVLVVWLLSRLGPRLLGVDLAAECRKLEEEMGVKRQEEGVTSAYFPVVIRGYAVPEFVAGLSIQELEARFQDRRVCVERLRRGRELVDEPDLSLRLLSGDRIALSGRREWLVSADNPLHGHEVDDPELLELPVVEVDVFVTRGELAGHTLAELAQEAGARGVYLRRITRAGVELPRTAASRIEPGDVLRLVGIRRNVERIADQLGYPEWPSHRTNLATVAVAILLGGLIGLPVLALGQIKLSLSVFVGALLTGLVTGWLCTMKRRLGPFPGPALWLFENLGLTAFLALVGIEAGPDFVRGLLESGPALIAAGILITSLPHIVTILIGKHLFKLHPGILLGVCCGAGTSAPALAAVEEVADSKVPALGYGVGCALGNVILALWGTVVVLLIGG
jgi:putative transport protein